MTDKKINLAVAFLQSQPSSAAAVLEEQPIEDVALFLQGIHYKQSAAVLKMMLPQYTARLFKYLEPAVCAGFLSEMDTSLIAAIMRHSDNEINSKVLELLPEKTRLTCLLLLNYAETAVGAWMTTNYIVLPDDCNVETARARISSAPNSADVDTVFIVDRERHLQGKIGVISLLKEPLQKPITQAMQTNPEVIPGRASLISASNDSLWKHREYVAVVNKNHQLVGVLRHIDLRRGLEEISTTISEPRGSDPIAGIWEVYGSSLLALFNTVGEATHFKKP